MSPLLFVKEVTQIGVLRGMLETFFLPFKFMKGA